MTALRRKAVQAAERLPVAVSRATRRYSTKEHGNAGEQAHHSGTDHGHHSGPKDESLGGGFYAVVATVPIAIGVYAAARPGKDGELSGFSKFIDSFSHYQEKYAARNALHTSAIQQAAFDRNLYQSSKGTTHIELRFPEIFNTGSPYNGIAGHRARNLDEVVAHYDKLNVESEERKAKALAKKN